MANAATAGQERVVNHCRCCLPASVMPHRCQMRRGVDCRNARGSRKFRAHQQPGEGFAAVRFLENTSRDKHRLFDVRREQRWVVANAMGRGTTPNADLWQRRSSWLVTPNVEARVVLQLRPSQFRADAVLPRGDILAPRRLNALRGLASLQGGRRQAGMVAARRGLVSPRLKQAQPLPAQSPALASISSATPVMVALLFPKRIDT